MTKPYVRHRWIGRDGCSSCLTCGLEVEEVLDEDTEYLAPSCPGKTWVCPTRDNMGPHLIVADGAGGAECYFCGRPDKRLGKAS